MRRLLLSAVAVAAISTWAAQPARAQLAVVCPTCASEFTQILSWAKSLINEAKSIAQQAQQIVIETNQLTQLVATVNELMTIYGAFTGVRDIGSALGALSLVGIQNPLPINPYALQNLISGAGGVQGTMGSLGALYTGNLAANRVYSPNGTDWQAQQLQANANGLAGIQSLAQRALQAASDRLQQLVGLRTRLATATDPKDIMDLHAQISTTQADAQAQQLQAQHIQTLAQLQPRVIAQQNAEYERQDICRYIAYLRGNEDGIAGAPDCSSQQTPSAAAPVSFLATQDTPSTNDGTTSVNLGNNSGMTTPGGGSALDTMMSTAWGASAAQNAATLGVNPEALAATCVLETGCQNINNRSGTGANGAFQMVSGTYRDALQTALAQNPGLSATGDRSDPATESIAAAQVLKTTVLGLQSSGIAQPTLLDVRGAFNFGAGYAAQLAQAPSNQTMSSILTGYSPATLASNGISPGETIGQWRAGITAKLGASANAPVLAI